MPSRTDFLVIGIDPGKTGAYAALTPTRAFVYDLNLDTLLWHLRSWQQQLKVRVFIEKQQSYPNDKRGSIAAFTLGRNYGQLLGICQTLDLDVTEVRSQVWKKELELIKKDKDASRAKATALFPVCAEQLVREKDHGRAEALLIAHFGRATLEA